MTEPVSYAILAAPGDDPYRILQLTDFHHDTENLRAIEQTYTDIRAMIDAYSPDLLAVTGDIWCGDTDPEHAPEYMRNELARLGALGIPWSFTWGNHDYIGDFDESMRTIAATANIVAPRGDGRGNFRIELRGARDDSARWDIYFLNSHTECLLPEDVAWLERESLRLRALRNAEVPSIAFFHIPLKQFEIARLEGRVRGTAQEEVLYWGDDGTRFDFIRRAGVRACFVGHSHVNDFWFEQDGVILAYGRATGHGGYGAELLSKGAKLIELSPTNSEFTFRTVYSDGK